MSTARGPNQMAVLIEAKIVELKAQRVHVAPGNDRRALNRLLRQNKDLLRWCQTRAGYRTALMPSDLAGNEDRIADA